MNRLLKQFLSANTILIAIILFSTRVFAEKRDLYISGRITMKPLPNYSGNYGFRWKDLLSGNTMTVPIRKDANGNFAVTLHIDSYEQITLMPEIMINGIPGYTFNLLSFFGAPGQKMEIQIPEKGSGVQFKGDFARENTEYQHYLTLFNLNPFSENYYQDASRLKGNYALAKDTILKKLNAVLNFNEMYYKQYKPCAFVKKQTSYNARYGAVNQMITLVALENITDSITNDFFHSINTPVSNPDAAGNERYKNFLTANYLFHKSKINYPKVRINSKDLSVFVLRNYPDLDAQNKSVLKRFVDSGMGESTKEFVQVYDDYWDDYYATLEQNMPEFSYFITLPDTYLRELYTTRVLYKHFETGKINLIKSKLDKYNTVVKNDSIKTKFLRDYQKSLPTAVPKTISSRSILHDISDKNDPGFIDSIINSYNGKVIYIDIWATWCAPCIAEMKTSKKLRDTLKNENIVFIYLCARSGSKLAWKNLIATEQIESHNYFLSMKQSDLLAKRFGYRTIPHHVLVDKSGVVVDADATAPGHTQTISTLKKLL